MADTISNFNSLKDFWSPVGISVITLYLTFVISRINDYLISKSNIKAKRLSYIDFFTLELKKLISAFDSLLEDLDEGSSIFQYKNINFANNAIQELKSMRQDVVIFPDEDIRERTINTIDVASSLATGIQALENLKDQWRKDYDNSISSTNYEINGLRMELLKYNITLDSNLILGSLDKKKINPKLLTYIYQMIQGSQGINEKKNVALNNFTNSVSFAKDKRTVLSNRILDVKSKLTELNDDFENLRENILKEGFAFF